MRATTIQNLLSTLDLLAGLLVLAILNGFSFGSTDDLGLIAFVYRWHDATPFLGDMRFGEWPNVYYMFYVGYMVALSYLMPIEWGLVASAVACQLILLIALRRLALVVFSLRVPAVLFALLLPGYDNSQLVGGYHLLSSGFSTHFVAIPLVLLGMSYVYEKRRWPALALLVPSGVLNPRLGAIGACLYVLQWYWMQGLQVRLRIAKVVGVALSLLLIAYVAWAATRAFDPATMELYATWMFVRAPWHYAPASWTPSIFVNCALVAAFLLLQWIVRKEEQARSLLFVSYICFGMILATIAHNLVRVEPLLLVSNPFQLGPFVLAIAYLFVAVTLILRLNAGQYLSSIVVLILPDLQSRLVALLIAETIYIWSAASAKPGGTGWPHRMEIVAVALQLAAVLAMLRFLPGPWKQFSYAPFATGLLATAVVALLSGVAAYRVAALTPLRVLAIVVAGSAAIALVTGQRLQGIKMLTLKDRGTAGLCGYVAAHTAPEASFVVPPEMHSFPADCHRSTFFNFTHLPLQLVLIPEWISRMKQTRLVPDGIDLSMLRAPLSLDFQRYRTLTADDFRGISSRYPKVRYVVTDPGLQLGLPVLYQDNRYALHEIVPAAAKP